MDGWMRRFRQEPAINYLSSWIRFWQTLGFSVLLHGIGACEGPSGYVRTQQPVGWLQLYHLCSSFSALVWSQHVSHVSNVLCLTVTLFHDIGPLVEPR